MSTSTAVSVRATRIYIKAFRELAERKGKSMADLVRIALDKEYGDEIQHWVSFFESADYKNSHLAISSDDAQDTAVRPRG